MSDRNREFPALLEARLNDYLARVARGSVAVSRFLTPGERKQTERWLTAQGVRAQACFWGGYSGAERQCLFLLPDFYLDMPELMPKDGENPADALPDPEADAVASILVRGSGFRVLNHRDYLGSLLGLGLERDALGDIAVQNEHEAVVFCASRIAPFLLSDLHKVASDTVHCERYTPDGQFTDGRNYRPIADTVASPRLDCVVAALTNLSREEAQRAVRAGLVEVDFEPEDRVDRTLAPPATLSIRGYGRYLLRSFDGETRRGRLRMRADQLV